MTYLELINDVLIRLRETTVSTNAENNLLYFDWQVCQ
jgi:hypothetical protein